MSKTTNLNPRRAMLDTRVERASATDMTRANVRYNLVDAVTAGEVDAGLSLGLALAYAEYPATVADLTDADVDAMLARMDELLGGGQ